MSAVLVTGAAGMLGQDLLAVLHGTGAHKATARTRAELDITDPVAVAAAVAGHDVVINTAAWTDVDSAETREQEATAVNGAGVANLAGGCARPAPGSSTSPPTTSSPGTPPLPTPRTPRPIRSTRTAAASWPESSPCGGWPPRPVTWCGRPGSTVRTGRTSSRPCCGWRANGSILDVVDDQRGQPTWSFALAQQLVALADAALAGRAAPGVYHGTAAGETTWYGLARAALEERGLDPDRVRPTTSERFVRPARRPSYSVLGHERWAAAGIDAQPQWRASLSEALRNGNW